MISIPDLKIWLKPNAKSMPDIRHHIAKKLKIDITRINSYRIIKQSVDARNKNKPALLYNILASLDDENIPPIACTEEYLNSIKSNKEIKSPIIVGTGPAGIMAAWLLASLGHKPIIIERGKKVEDRKNDINEFKEKRTINANSNYLFGEGGAGTFSDGKLFTRTKDPRISVILDIFVKAGAPEEIRYLAHPHIGSDYLPKMLKNLREDIEQKGGEFLWNTEVSDIIINNKTNNCEGVILSDGKQIKAPKSLIAPGHSARDLLHNLATKNISHTTKGYQIGCRAEHPQSIITKSQYGNNPILGAAAYNIVNKPKQNTLGVTSFCMCPGGEIIAATTDNKSLSTNGMSPYARNGFFANAALIARQTKATYKESFETIKNIEEACFKNGGADFSAPSQSIKAFLRNEVPKQEIKSSYHFGTKPTRLDKFLPKEITIALKEAVKYFDKRIPEYINQGNFIGTETRISSPLRFERTDDLSSSLKNLYIAGEGAGYAGGITSAAIDGMKLAEKMVN